MNQNYLVKINTLMHSFLSYLTESKVTGTYSDNHASYDVGKIVDLVKQHRIPVKEKKISSLLKKNHEVDTKEGNLGKLLERPNKRFLKRVKKANTRYPILLSTSGWIIDGTHRLAKLYMADKTHIKTQVVPNKLLKLAKK